MDHTLALIGLAHQGDKEARDTVFKENMGLVYSVAKRFLGRGLEMEELFQIGSIGLLKAVDKFDFSYEVKFSTYAVPMISGEIKRFLRDDGMIKVSRSLKEMANKIYFCQEQLQEKLGREPTVEEITRELHISLDDLTMALEASGDIESLQKPIYQQEGQEIRLMDKLQGGEKVEDRILDHMLLEELLDSLDQMERQLICLRYFENQTQTQAGKERGISQVQVSRMEKRILKRMREKIIKEC